MRLKDRTAIITGGMRGIGRAIAERFIAEGARVMLSDIDAEGVANTARELGCAARPADVSQKADIDRLVQETIAEFGQIDILVNNAGITHAADFLDLTVEDFDRVIGINLRGAFLASQAVARHMIPRRSGTIVNMSSVNAVFAIPNQIPYAVSKGGMNQLTKVTAMALAPHGIRVNAIGPGTIMTDMGRSIMNDEAMRQRVMSRTPLGRCGEPSEVASVAAFLASDDASYLSGQTIYPDGGRLALNYTVPVA
ncbi:MAG TPA: SDR family oxidoreductase [Aliidongia sp.]|uniref:SDR family NAD(P)-dependent oxidoreductase n=1 Tax=Aliidongia sp. TaxID=1914230 RepID=UPI002DDCCEAC|nr:SDR family oxidoreductase [Aliidongia sp.]HEV2676118.1 SDR family oxidoreductase [Aliidongia sp.]